MAAVSLFWDTNMAAVRSCENAQYRFEGNHGGMQRGHLRNELFLTSLLTCKRTQQLPTLGVDGTMFRPFARG